MFYYHARIIAEKPTGRLLKDDLLFYVEEVVQGRIIYLVKNGMVFYPDFTTHKDYKTWYKSSFFPL